MSRFTPSQQLAITAEGRNILVSAGAGSGKTTVLSERVIHLLKRGYSLDRMLILTFTKNAAYNMKEKIKKRLQSESDLAGQIQLIEGADIDTFDAFNQKIAKKYADQLGLKDEFTIVNPATFQMVKRRFLTARFEDYFRESNSDFLRMAEAYTEKDDAVLIDLVIRIEESLSLLENPEQYLYDRLTDQPLFDLEDIYRQLLERYQQRLKYFLDQVAATINCEDNYLLALTGRIEPLLQYRDFDTFKASLSEIKRLPSLRGADDLTKERIDYLARTYYRPVRREVSELIEERRFASVYLRQQKAAEFLYREVGALRAYLNNYKKEHNAYEFGDIAAEVLRLLRDFPAQRAEIREHYQEIMVDEYQDNSDLQEAVVNLLESGNLFLVGDIKQSIYRFRNANPQLFAARYRAYKENPSLGLVIDMNENFRSSPAVVDEVNTIFRAAMTADFGGADYRRDHLITAANPIYREQAFSNRLLGPCCDLELSPVEREIAAVAADIVVRRSREGLDYKDFCLLIDRGTEFNTIVRIFADYGIPLAVSLNGDLTSFQMTSLLCDLLVVLQGAVVNQTGNTSFRHAYAAVARSWLYEQSDQEIYDTFKSGDFASRRPWQDIREVGCRCRHRPLVYQFVELLKAVRLLARLPHSDDFETNFKLLDAFIDTLGELEALGSDLAAAIEYFGFISDSKTRYLTKLASGAENAVSLTNIHMAKGLEYNHCYFLLLAKRYNEGDYRARFKFSPRFGVILPIVSQDFKSENAEVDGLASPLDKLYCAAEKRRDREERLRLLYVALTRAKHSLTLVVPEGERQLQAVEECKNFADLLEATGAFKRARPVSFLEADIELSSTLPPEVPDLGYVYRPLGWQPSEAKKSARPSTRTVHRSKALLEQGERLHQILADLDLRSPDLGFVESAADRQRVEDFLSQEIFADLSDADIFQEYEFYDPSRRSAGSIDLLLLWSDRAVIVDYKLKNTDDPAYRHQLLAYGLFVEENFGRPVELYLYSLVDGRLERLAAEAI